MAYQTEVTKISQWWKVYQTSPIYFHCPTACVNIIIVEDIGDKRVSLDECLNRRGLNAAPNKKAK